MDRSVTRYAARVSLAGGVASWAIFIGSLFLGGLDPSPALAAILRAASGTALLLAVVASGLGLFALIRGPERVLSAFALVLTLLWLLVFTGSIFALLA